MVSFSYSKMNKFVVKTGKNCHRVFVSGGNCIYFFSLYHNDWILSLDDKDNIEVRKLLQ